MRKIQCEMRENCSNPVTHIGEKGYIYCAKCIVHRRGRERCRKMRAWELQLIRDGKPLPSYECDTSKEVV